MGGLSKITLKEIFLYLSMLSAAAASSGCVNSYHDVHSRYLNETPPVNYRVENGQKKKFLDIEWILHMTKDKVILGGTPDQTRSPYGLEDILVPGKDSKKIRLSEWEKPTFARLAPVKKMIEKQSAFYSINPLWAAIFFNFESLLNPTDFNELTNDYGIGQVKIPSANFARIWIGDKNSPYYNPDFDPAGNIYDPQTNIIISMMLHRYNIERLGLKDSDQVYATYLLGPDSINSDGSLSEDGKKVMDSFRGRFKLYERVVPLFSLYDQDNTTTDDPDVKKVLEIYQENDDPKEMYKELLTHFLGKLEGNLLANAESVLTFDDCVVYAKTLDLSYKVNQSDNFSRLIKVGDSLLLTTKEEKWLNERVQRSYDILTKYVLKKGT
jgi:hypothetical protein